MAERSGVAVLAGLAGRAAGQSGVYDVSDGEAVLCRAEAEQFDCDFRADVRALHGHVGFAVLPGVRQPMAVGFQSNEIERVMLIDQPGSL